MRFFETAFVLFFVAIGVIGVPVVERQTTGSVATILTDLHGTINPFAQQMLYATSDNATMSNLSPIIDNISAAVTGAVDKMKQIQGQSSNVIRASSVDALDTNDIASLLASIITLIFQAASAILSVVDSSSESVIVDLLSELGKLVLSLLAITLTLITGLIPSLATLLGPIISIVASLGLSSLLASLLGGLL